VDEVCVGLRRSPIPNESVGRRRALSSGRLRWWPRWPATQCHADLSRGGGERSRRWMSCVTHLLERGQDRWTEETWHGLTRKKRIHRRDGGPTAGSTDGSGTSRSSSSHQPALVPVVPDVLLPAEDPQEEEYHRGSFRIRPAHLAHSTLITG